MATGTIVAQPFQFSKSTGKKITLGTPPDPKYPGDGAFSLVNGIRGDTVRFGQHWLGWQGPDMEAVIDLGGNEKISTVGLNIVNAEASWIHPPKNISVMISADGADYSEIMQIGADEILQRGQSQRIELGNQTARFVKVIARNAGIIPEGKPGAGSNAWLFVDEIVIE